MVDVNSIKDESPRGLASPQGGSRSRNGTPTSTHSSLLADGSSTTGPIEFISADGLKPATAMYATQIFSTMNESGGGSDTPSPRPYSEHVQYAPQSSISAGSNVGNGAATIYSSNGRPSIATTFAPSDPYYREYFTTVASGAGTPEPVYSPQLRQTQLGYADDTAMAVTTANFVERYVRQSYHGKGVIAAATAAGLTVDLPSPDSGIGADAITPRDQNTLQQVSPRPSTLTRVSSVTRRVIDDTDDVVSVLRLHRSVPDQFDTFGSFGAFSKNC